MMVAMRLMGLMATRPVEFYDRSRAIVEDKIFKKVWPNRHEYEQLEWQVLLNHLGKIHQQDANAILAEQEYQEAREHCLQVTESLRDNPPIPIEHNPDDYMIQLAYLAVRLLKPKNVVEIGVAYGNVSTMTLAAMAKNGQGKLSSIDLKPLRKNAQDYIGYMIPEHFRSSWELHRGASVRVLPKLLKELPSVDLSIHDSLSTYRNHKQELKLVAPYLSSHSGVIVNCAGQSKAFYEFNQAHSPQFTNCVHAKTEPDLIGFSIMQGNTRPPSDQEPAAAIDRAILN